MHPARLIYASANWLGWIGGVALLSAAAAIGLRPELFSRLEKRLERLPWTNGPAAPWLWAAAACGAAVALRLAMFRQYQLTGDSGVIAQFAWNFAHGHGWATSSEPPSHLAYHFSLTSPLLSPLLWLWPSAGVLALAQGLAIGAVAPGVFLLARRHSRSAVVPWLAALLAVSHPIYQCFMQTIIEDSVYAPALFIWAVYSWDRGERLRAVVFAALLLTTKEEAPLIFIGLGLHALWSRELERRSACLLIAAAVLVWLGEMKLIQGSRGPDVSAACADHWGYFQGLGGSGGAVVRTALSKPWLVARELVWPPEKIWTAARLVLMAGAFPLYGGSALLAGVVPWLVHQLAGAQSGFHKINAFYGGFVYGPLLWAGVLGLCRAERTIAAGRRHWLALIVFAAAGAGLAGEAGYYRSGLLPSSWESSVPRALSRIAPDSKVWCDSYLLPYAGLRHYVKKLPGGLPDCVFDAQLFLPDDVLLTTYWARLADPAVVERIMNFLNLNGFEIVFQEKDLILLHRRGAVPSRAAPERWIRLP